MSLKHLQVKIGATPDGKFGPQTFRLAANYFGFSHTEAVHFFAQCAHETSNFRLFEENLNYSADGLLKVFRKYYQTREEALSHHRRPELIANTVYSNRMGNGDFESGDGWRYKGRGAIQLTGKNNYNSFYEFMNFKIKPSIGSIATNYAFESALFYFKSNNLFDLCKDLKEETIKKLTKRINGGYNGLEHRIELTNKFSRWTVN